MSSTVHETQSAFDDKSNCRRARNFFKKTKHLIKFGMMICYLTHSFPMYPFFTP